LAQTYINRRSLEQQLKGGYTFYEADAPEALKALEKQLYYLTAYEPKPYCFKSVAVPKV